MKHLSAKTLAIARDFLMKKGFRPASGNPPKGIDLIVYPKDKDDSVIFVVVWERAKGDAPSEAIPTSDKGRSRRRAACSGVLKWLRTFGWNGEFHLNAVVVDASDSHKARLIEDFTITV